MTTMTLLMRFEYADGRMPVAMTSGGVTYYLAYDQVGSLKAVANAAGNVIRKIDYDSFGNIISDTDPAFAVPFGFAGGLHDRDTGLVRFGFRDYDPDVGRWTAKDPISFYGGDTDLYGYCVNDSVNLIDILGLKWWITVHSNPGSGISSSSNSNVGHGWVSITNDEDGITATIGIYPASGGYPAGPRPDFDRVPTESYTWEVSEQEASAAYGEMIKPGYSFLYDNCVDRVEAVLNVAGIEHPSFDTLGISNPTKLNDWLNDLNSESECP